MSTVSDKTAVQAPEDMVSIEIDGVEMQAPKGSMVIQAADKAGIAIPRFCYHEKLSIAANCRMCLVDVEKAPKPLPACATPVADGMKVFTQSRRALDAQRAVMEFLLINHPLDCPICDQGGECELQDLAMGYGRSVSRFSERKRVVPDEDLGSLVSTDMTRCIQCTRCVRFLEEISGTYELGGIGRGEHMEIKTWVGRSIESELGGNIIDLCPVGALTNRPFRFRARAWELSARAGVSVHDALGSAYHAHVMRDHVYRNVPRANEAINESWLSDRDRWASEGLYHEERLTTPRIKRDGEWQDASWEDALLAASEHLRELPGEQWAALAGSFASSEEYYLVQKLMRALGCTDLDHRLDQLDFSTQDSAAGLPSFGISLPALQASDHIVLVAGNPRHEAPIIGHRVRQAWRGGTRVDAINPLTCDFNFELGCERIAGPNQWLDELCGLAQALGAQVDGPLADHIAKAQPDDQQRELAQALKDAQAPVLLLGHLAQRHAQASWIRAAAEAVAQACGGRVAALPSQANAAGAWAAGMLPHRGAGAESVSAGRHAGEMLTQGAAGYFLFQCEPGTDSAWGAQAQQQLEQAKHVICLSAYRSAALDQVADVMLPVTAGIEVSGTWVNAFGDVAQQSAGVRPQGDTRPGWRVLRVLGNLLELDGFDYQDLGELQAELLPLIEAARNHAGGQPSLSGQPATVDGLQRLAERPLYATDGIVRRSQALQDSPHGEGGFCAINQATAEKLGLSEPVRVKVQHDGFSASLPLRIDDSLADQVAYVPFAVPGSAGLGVINASLEVSVDSSAEDSSAKGGASDA